MPCCQQRAAALSPQQSSRRHHPSAARAGAQQRQQRGPTTTPPGSSSSSSSSSSSRRRSSRRLQAGGHAPSGMGGRGGDGGQQLGPRGGHPDLQDKLEEFARAAPLDQSSEQVARLVAGNFGIFFAAVAAFALIAFDVFGAAHGGLGLFPRLVDLPTHEWVVAHVPEGVRHLLFEKLLSNVPTGLALLGWAVCSASAVAQDPVVNSRRVALAVAALAFLGGGALHRGDVILVYELKQAFHRARPSLLGSSLSFPSGHTASAVFVVGTLLFILLPLSVPSAESEEEYVERLPAEAEENLRGFVGAWRQAASRLRAAAVPLWFWSTLITAAGRVLADVHWVSDTLSGACLGTAVVSLLAFLINRYTGYRHSRSKEA